ncbi:MAG: L-seryl-tRNA(Sec) selenium transferase [Candidatus Marinimicrobia bacterium]|nr:L-seryl-tRNA(Sec) selenium transferase [Candidatus Neomarinimicrobiota bacterium]|tara:strand:- start:916 stop:2301 length:1386 start_codon:yes stop_codon:yes gene_type:complete
MSKSINQTLRELPSVNKIIEEINPRNYYLPYSIIIKTVRNCIAEFRKDIIIGRKLNINDLYLLIIEKLKKLNKSSIQTVINGTGIILHTGLGRAPISPEILNNSFNKLSGYVNIELNTKDGSRGERNNHVKWLLEGLTSSKDSVIVNNCASAVLLALNTFGESKEVIVSRGEQVEIGGSFRIPDVIKKAGCNLVEVGTTNRTHLKDYKNAICKNTGLILVAHTSNYVIEGFTKSVSIEELVPLAKAKRIPLIIDLGSGALTELNKFNLPSEPLVQYYIKAGVDAVTFSGDKLLGGPQCGIICGKSDIIRKIRQNALYRALRCDKMIYTILEETLRTYYTPTSIKKNNLTWDLFLRPTSDLDILGENILKGLSNSVLKISGIKLNKSKVEAGSGSLPVKSIESRALVFESKKLKAKEIHARFLYQSPSILGFIHNKKFRLDLKAIFPRQEKFIQNSIEEIFS